MDLWIRSQDRLSLEKVDLIVVNGSDVFSRGEIIGTYDTCERALEVLDEIQGKIAQNECLKQIMPKVTDIRGYEEKFGKLFKEEIYEMPEE